MEDTVRADVLKRFSFIEGHLNGVRKMIEEDKYCPEVLKQTYAVRRAIEKMEAMMLDGHLHHCVVEGIKEGREEQVIHELLDSEAQGGVRVSDRHARFATALAAFRASRWQAAAEIFADLHREQPDDGPSRFYTDLCASYLANGPDSFESGAVRLSGK